MGWSAAGSTFAQSQSTKKAVEEKSEREVGCWCWWRKEGREKAEIEFWKLFLRLDNNARKGGWLLVLVEKREERESRDRLLEPFFKGSI